MKSKAIKFPAMACFFLPFFFTGIISFAQTLNSYPILDGRFVLDPVVAGTNILKVNLQIKKNNLPDKTVRLGPSTFKFDYNNQVLELAADPQEESPNNNDNTLDYDDYIFNNVIVAANGYFKPVDGTLTTPDPNKPAYIVERRLVSNAVDTYYVYGTLYHNYDLQKEANEPDLSDLALNLNTWTTVVTIKFKIKQTGNVGLEWAYAPYDPANPESSDFTNSGHFKEIITFESGSKYAPELGAFTDNNESVTYTAPSGTLSSAGCGIPGGPLVINYTATGINQQAGAVGFYVYYRSVDGTYRTADTRDLLRTGSFGWPAATTLINQSLTETVTKDGIQYDRRIKYESSDGNQDNDLWSADTPIDILSLTFTPSHGSGIRFYLEPITFQNYSGENYVVTSNQRAACSETTPALPVTLISFTGRIVKKNQVNVAQLSWSTAMEKNNKEFVLEKSADAKTFEKVGTEKGVGNSNEITKYSFTDYKPFKGASYYRLKQIDFNGEYEYSKIVQVQNENQQAVAFGINSAQPNPFAEKVGVTLTLPTEEKVTLELFDGCGKIVKSKKIALNAVENKYIIEDLQNFSPGFYTIKVNYNGKSDAYKLLKK